MRRLHHPIEPEVLVTAKRAFKESNDSPDKAWSDFGNRSPGDQKSGKEIVRGLLCAMQNGHCAYCEGAPKGSHIDHFLRKGRHPDATFEWENLLVSCTHEKQCGRFKDRQNYAEPDLIHPAMENPEDYLVFSAHDASVQPKEGISPAARTKASETIRVLGLNRPDLRKARHAKAQAYKKQIVSHVEGGCSKTDFETQILGTPYQTCLRHIVLGTP